jgi:hypothetical protein
MDSSQSILPPTLPPDPPQFYETRDLARKALQESATKQGFALVVKRSDRKRVDLHCSLWPDPTKKGPSVPSKAKSREVIKIRTNCPHKIQI